MWLIVLLLLCYYFTLVYMIIMVHLRRVLTAWSTRVSETCLKSHFVDLALFLNLLACLLNQMQHAPDLIMPRIQYIAL